MKKGHTCDVVTYGINKESDFKANSIKYQCENGNIYSEFDVAGSRLKHVLLELPGEFSIYNALCAIAITEQFNLPTDKVLAALKKARIPGRVEMMSVSENFSVMIDYAHNAMSLKSLLTTIKEYKPKRMVTLFGCGGNRSADRRFEMGEISGKMSDLTIITSDNPRYEEPADIMKDIETGVNRSGGNYIMIEDRQEAVRYAILNALAGDVIIIAGKGHEDYQEIKGIKYHMSDKELVIEAAKELVN
jgi:UDP-N-acetylmuramoyl-L-alanyl-D-glutamate--2,6-diaminopimelate ligase